MPHEAVLAGIEHETARPSAGRLVPVVGVLLLGVPAVALYHSVVAGMVSDWVNDPALSFACLVPPLVAYLLWQRRHSLRKVQRDPSLLGIGVIFVSMLVYLVGRLGAEFYLLRLSLLGVLGGLVVTFHGVPMMKKLGFEFVLLLSAIPLPGVIYNSFAVPLQLFASAVATDTVQWAGITAYRDGNVIHLADISLGIEEACSGLHSLTAMVVGSLVIGKAATSRLWIRCALFALAVGLAIGVNVVRVTGTALLAEADHRYALGFYHSFSGWLVFLVGLGLLLACARLLTGLTERRPTVR